MTRFLLIDQARDGTPRYLTTAGTWSDSSRDATRFWTFEGARNAVPWHDLLHCRVLAVEELGGVHAAQLVLQRDELGAAQA